MNRRFGGMSVLIIALAALGLLMICAFSASASITGDAPPSTGDWNVKNPTVVRNEVIVVNGNIMIESTLSVFDSTIRVNGLSHDEYSLTVDGRGKLSAADSRFAPLNTSNGYGFLVLGELSLDNTVLEGCAMGLQIRTDKKVIVSDCTVLNPSGKGLYLVNATDTLIEDTTLMLNNMTAFKLNATLPDRTSYDVTITSAAIHISGGEPQLRGIDIYLNGDMMGEVRIIKEDYYGRNYIRWHFHMLLIDSESMADISGVNIRNGTVNFNISYYLDNNYTSMGRWYTYSYFYAYTISIPSYRDVSLRALSLENVALGTHATNSYYSGNPIYGHSVYEYPQTMMFIRAFIDEGFTDPGPHRYSLTIADTDFGDLASTWTPLLDTHLYTAYSGVIPPTFDSRIVIDNVKVNGGSGIFKFGETPSFPLFKTYYMYVRISNSTFTNMTGLVCSPNYQWGPGTAPGTKSIYLYETLLVENNLFRHNTGSGNGLIYYPYNSLYQRTNLYDRYNIFSENTFRDNQGRLFDMQGRSYQDLFGKERTILDGNLFLNNSESGADYLLYTNFREVASIVNNQFIDNKYSYGIRLHCEGGDLNGKKPSDYLISNNTFRNTNSPLSDKPWFEINWGGSLEVSYNNISDIETWFIRLDEVTDAALYASLDFHHNEIANNNGTMIWFHHTGEYHSRLTVNVEHNKIWNNPGPVMDYRVDSNLDTYDYNARIIIRNNTAYGCNDRVFKTYGEVFIEDNYFEQCDGYVIDLQYLYMAPPVISRNQVVDCDDIYYIVGKDKGGLKMALSMSDSSIDCTGNVFYFKNLVVARKGIDISSKPSLAIIAEGSQVDAVQSKIPIGSGQVIESGSINVWFSIELWVTWGDSNGEDTDKPVNEALVIRNARSGAYFGSEYTDDAGHLQATRYPQWSIQEMFYTLWTPYTISVSKVGAVQEYTIDLDQDYVGPNALRFLLVDGYVPDIRITSIFDDDHFSLTDITIYGFVFEDGSGLKQVTVSYNIEGEEEIPSVEVGVDGNGNFHHTFRDLPEGWIVIHARVMDIAVNSNETSVRIMIDRTAPMLEVVEPDEGIVTRFPTMMVICNIEVGATLRINEREIPVTSGTVSEPIGLSEGSNTITIDATDKAGNVAVEIRTITLDRYTPPFTVLEPSDGLVVTTTLVTVKGDAELGTMLSISVFGPGEDLLNEPMVLGIDGTFSHEVELVDGKNVIVVSGEDDAGNVASISRTVTVDTTAPNLEVHHPPNNYYTNERTVVVRATVDNDVIAFLNGDRITHQGTIEVEVDLNEGPNIIEIRLVDAVGHEITHRLTVVLDTEAPGLSIDLPTTDHIKTNQPGVQVVGTATGEVDTLTIGGLAAAVDVDGRFDSTVSLSGEGPTDIVVEATDLAGNAATLTIHVDFSTEQPILNVRYLPSESSVKASDNSLVIEGQTTPGIGMIEVAHTSGGVTSYEEYSPIDPDGYFSISMRLEEGENVIVLRVVNEYGNEIESEAHTVTYTYKPTAAEEEEGTELSGVELGLVIVALSIALIVTVVLVTRGLSKRR